MKKILSRAIIQISRWMNRLLTALHNVGAVFHEPYANVKKESFGMKGLLTEILEERGAILPRGIELTKDRPAAIAASMFTDEIVAEVKRRFTCGSIRYPYKTIWANLKREMRNEVEKIQLTWKEDAHRPCLRPRCKWYLVEN